MFQPDNKNYEEYVMNHIKKGTTTCALTCKDGVVLAADTRASAGYFIVDRNVMKIQKIDEHLGMTIAGGVADAQNLVDLLRYNANLYRLSNNQKLIPVKSAARLCSNVLFNQRYYPYYVLILMGGCDKNGDGTEIYNIEPFGAIPTHRCSSTGSGSPVAYGYLESEYKKDLSVNEAYKTAIHAIAAAIRRNSGTGDNINAVIIDKDGYRELSKEVKDAVQAVY
jgi:proteasome beta subunit